MPLNDSDLTLNQTQMVSRASILKSEQSLVNYDEENLKSERNMERSKFQVFNAMSLGNYEKPCKDTKE